MTGDYDMGESCPRPTADENYVLIVQNPGLGTVQPPIHKLPPIRHIYGKPSHIHNDSTKTLIQNWSFSVQSPGPNQGIDYVEMNKDGISQKFSTSKEFRQLQKSCVA